MNAKNIDYTLFFLVFGLVIFGMIMISSVSVYPSYNVTSRMVELGRLDEANNWFYLVRNIMHVTIASLLFAFFVKFPIETVERNARQIFVGGMVFLALVLIIGAEYNGARGWISIPYVPFSLQPVEFMKLALIIYLASYLKRNKANIESFKHGFMPFFLIMCSVMFLIVLQPDFGSVLIMGPLCVILYFVGGGSVRYIAIMGVVFATLAGSVYALGMHAEGEERNTFSYITDRIDNFLTDSKTSIANKTINFQTEQGLIAIGSGWFSGVGFGKSLQKFGYLPETQGDFIFSVIAEELGFLGVSFLICIYLAIVYRGFRIARMVEDLFSKYVAVGITSWIAIQAFVNIGVNLNIIPLTGVTLPFVSYGGSSLLSLLIGVAILLGVSRQIRPSSGYAKSYSRMARQD